MIRGQSKLKGKIHSGLRSGKLQLQANNVGGLANDGLTRGDDVQGLYEGYFIGIIKNWELYVKVI